MSKPMLVTWPFVMLLLDYWPLGRMQNAECRMQNAQATTRTRTTHHALTLHVSRILSSCSWKSFPSLPSRRGERRDLPGAAAGGCFGGG